MASRDFYSRNVFINCPFSPDYKPMFSAILFAVYACGFRPRCAREIADSGEIRLGKIEGIIRQSKFGVHDISYMHLDPATKLPRFNMPFELGLFLAAKSFGSTRDKAKVSLILDSGRYRYRDALSDVSGQDIASHNGDPATAIREVRDWLDSSRGGQVSLPGGSYIAEQHQTFSRELPSASRELKLDPAELTYADLCRAIESWRAENM